MKKKSLSKVIAGVAAITVITLLVLAGTASAFSINLGSLSNSNPTINDVITATSSIEIQSNERVDIREINLGFAGTPERLCIFDVDGNPISGCDGITIIRTGGNTEYTFGYGYRYGEGFGFYDFYNGISDTNLTYDITIETTNFPPGEYNANLYVKFDINGYESPSQTLSVIPLNSHGRVTICKVNPNGNGNDHTIVIPTQSVFKHLRNGDYLGPCITASNNLIGESSENSLIGESREVNY